MNLPAPITSKLRKLLPLLASDKDGEVLGAARAIHRTLQSAGSDLHDLAARLADNNEPDLELDPDPPPQAWKPPPWRNPAGPCRWGDLGPDERKNALIFISGLPLSGWERQFLTDITGRVVRAPWVSLSPKQAEVLNGLLRRLWETTP